MSSDEYFDDDIDPAILQELDLLEAAAFARNPPPANENNPPPLAGKQPTAIEISDLDDYGSFSLDDAQLKQFDDICAQNLDGRPVAGPSHTAPRFAQRTSSKSTVQTTLFGEILQPGVKTSNRTFQRTSSKAAQREEKRTKQWDHTVFAKTGWKSSKGKQKLSFDADDDVEPEEVEFEQFPNPTAAIE